MDNMDENNELYELTIIVSNYNQACYLPKAIQSILMQKVNFLYQIIIVDDCSQKDDSRKIIAEYEKNNANIRAVLSDNNRGYLTNILRAKKITKTKYFCLLDADDYWCDKDYLQRAYDFLEEHVDYVIYENNVYVLPVGGEENSKLKCFVGENVKSGTFTRYNLVDGKYVPITQTTGMFFRNVIFKNGIPTIMIGAVGTLSERSFEGDHDRFIMHLKHGKAYYDSRPVGVYRHTATGIWVGMNDSGKMLLNARAYMDYYSYYESDKIFFINEAWKFLIEYFNLKAKEIRSRDYEDVVYLEGEIQNVNEIYSFCNQKGVTLMSHRISWKRKIKKILNIIFREEL